MHLLNNVEEIAQNGCALSYVRRTNIIPSTMITHIHQGNHSRTIGKSRVVDKASEYIRTEHPLRAAFYERTKTMHESWQAWMGVRYDPRGVCGIVKHVTEVGLDKCPACVREVSCRLFKISVGFKSRSSLLDGRYL